MLSFLYVYSDHSILECYNLFSGVELSMRSFFVISLQFFINLIRRKYFRIQACMNTGSFLPSITKIFEKRLYEHLSDIMKDKLSPFLCGFRKQHSTQHALIHITEKWMTLELLWLSLWTHLKHTTAFLLIS